jgi:hypothetical protein
MSLGHRPFRNIAGTGRFSRLPDTPEPPQPLGPPHTGRLTPGISPLLRNTPKTISPSSSGRVHRAMFTPPKFDFSRGCPCPGTRKPLGGNFAGKSSWRMAGIGLLDPGRPQFPSLGSIPSETGQILPHLRRGPHSGSTPNSHFCRWCPHFPRPRHHLPQPCSRRVHQAGALPAHSYRHPRGPATRGVVRGCMPSPSSHRVAFPQQPEACSSPLSGPDPPKRR